MKNWKSLVWSSILAVAGLSHAPGVLAADELSWYVGGGLGMSDAQRTTSWGQQVDAIFLTNGFTTNTLISSHETAWKIFGGYQFNQNFAVEAGYTYFGKFDGTTYISAPAPGLGAGKWEASSPLNVAVVGTVPVWDRLSAIGKLGLAYTKVTVTVSAPTPISLSASRVQPLLGVGLKYDFTKAFTVRGEFEHFNNVGDGSNTGQTAINVWSLSGQYHF